MAYAALSRAEGTSSGFAEEGTSSNDANPPSRARSCHTSSSAFPSGGALRPSADADADALDSPGLRGDSEETPRTSLRADDAEDFVGDAKEVLGVIGA